MNDAFWKARNRAVLATAMVDAWAAAGARPAVDMNIVQQHIEGWVATQMQAEREMEQAQEEEFVATAPPTPAPAPVPPVSVPTPFVPAPAKVAYGPTVAMTPLPVKPGSRIPPGAALPVADDDDLDEEDDDDDTDEDDTDAPAPARGTTRAGKGKGRRGSAI